MAAPSVARKKSQNFFCLKSVSGIIDPFSIKKMKKKIFTGKMTKKDQTPQGSEGGPRGVWQKTTVFPDFFLLPSLSLNKLKIIIFLKSWKFFSQICNSSSRHYIGHGLGTASLPEVGTQCQHKFTASLSMNLLLQIQMFKP